MGTLHTVGRQQVKTYVYLTECIPVTKIGSKRIWHWLSPQDYVPHSKEHLYLHARSCYVSCKLVNKWCTMSYYQMTKHSPPTCTHCIWNVWNRHWSRSKREVILYDNARLHGVRMVRDTIRWLGWWTLFQPQYSFVHTDYDLFYSLENQFSGKYFTNKADLPQTLTEIFAPKTTDFNVAEGMLTCSTCLWRLPWELTVCQICCTFFSEISKTARSCLVTL